MARQRMIHPNLRKDDDLAAACSIPARYLWEGLWTIADRSGRLQDRPAWIKAELYPYDAVDIDALLRELIDHGCLSRYEVDGKRVLECRKFLAYQRPHPNEPSSVLPPSLDAIARNVADVADLALTESVTESDTRVGVGKRAKAPKQLPPTTGSSQALIDGYNGTLGAKITASPGNVKASERYYEAGYKLEQALAVFEAVRDGTTTTATWCRNENHAFEYLIRPPYVNGKTHERVLGPLDKIANELAASPTKPTPKGVIGSGLAPPTSEQIMAQYKRQAETNSRGPK